MKKKIEEKKLEDKVEKKAKSPRKQAEKKNVVEKIESKDRVVREKKESPVINLENSIFTLYQNQIVPHFLKKGVNRMAIPEIKKVCLHTCLGENFNDLKAIYNAANTLSAIACQKPVIVKVKGANALFKIKKGFPIGAKVTLRGRRMQNFLDRFIKFVSVMIRDFHGFPSTSFDGKGNYSFGLQDASVFKERLEESKVKFGLDINLIMTGKNDKMSYEVLKMMGFPFQS